MGSGNMLEASKVAVGSIYLTLNNIVSTLAALLGYAFLARTVSQEEVGIFSAFLLVSSFIQVISNFGLTSSLIKYVSELRGRREDYSAHLVASYVFKVPASLFLCSVLFVFSGTISTSLFGASSSQGYTELAALNAFISGMNPLLRSLLLGTSRMKRIASCSISSSIVRWASIVTLVYTGYGIYGAMVGWTIGNLALLILYLTSSLRLVSLEGGILRRSLEIFPGLISFSWPLFIATVINFLYSSYDLALILAFLPLSELGLYNLSYKGFGFLTMLATSLGQSLFPYYGAAYGREDHRAVSRGIKAASRYGMLIIFPLTLGIASISNPLISLYAGAGYESGGTILAILAVFGLSYGLLPAFQNVLTVYGKTKHVMLLNFLAVVSSLVLLPLLPVLGLNGLSLMKGSSIFVSLLLTVYFASRTVKVEIDRQAFAKALGAAAVTAIIILGIQQFCYDKFYLPAYILTGATVYLACVRMLKVLNKSDITLVRAIFGEKASKITTKVLGVKT